MFVKTKLKLEELESGEEFVAVYDHAPAIENVSRNLKNGGHTIQGVEEVKKHLWKVGIKNR